MIICENNTVFAKSDFWCKTRQPAPVSPTRGDDCCSGGRAERVRGSGEGGSSNVAKGASTTGVVVAW